MVNNIHCSIFIIFDLTTNIMTMVIIFIMFDHWIIMILVIITFIIMFDHWAGGCT